MNTISLPPVLGPQLVLSGVYFADDLVVYITEIEVDAVPFSTPRYLFVDPYWVEVTVSPSGDNSIHIFRQQSSFDNSCWFERAVCHVGGTLKFGDVIRIAKDTSEIAVYINQTKRLSHTLLEVDKL